HSLASPSTPRSHYTNPPTPSPTLSPYTTLFRSSNDQFTTSEDVALVIANPGVLANDSDVEGDTLTALLISGPSHGSLTLNANGSFTYTTRLNYNGHVAFAYNSNDGTVSGNTATV